MGSLFDEVGDASTLRTAVALFYRRVLADPGLAPWFAGVDMTRLRAHQLAFLVAALGGPDLFNGREIAEAHAGLKITDWAFDELIAHLATTLRDLGIAPAVVARVVRRLEALRPAVVHSGADETSDAASPPAGGVSPSASDAVSPPVAGPSAALPGC